MIAAQLSHETASGALTDVEFRADDDIHTARPGFFLAAPRTSVHGFRVAGNKPMRCLNLHAPPGGFLDRLRKSD